MGEEEDKADGWEWTVLFIVGVGGTVFLLFAPAIPMFSDIPKNPTAVGGVGLIMAYILQQKSAQASRARQERRKKDEDDAREDAE
jgi:hypothetical protein